MCKSDCVCCSTIEISEKRGLLMADAVDSDLMVEVFEIGPCCSGTTLGFFGSQISF